jgi:hypothetical protein
VSELSAEQTAFLIDASSDLRFDVISVDPNEVTNLPPTSD